MKRLIGCVLFLMLAGCSSSDLPKDQPTTLTFSMVVTDDVNPNFSGDATSFEVQVFELEDDSMFLAADYDQLANSAKAALKSNYVDHRDYSLVPQQFKFIDAFQIEDDTRYIAVMARYSNSESSDWKKVVKVKPVGHEYHLLMYFNKNEVVLRKVE